MCGIKYAGSSGSRHHIYMFWGERVPVVAGQKNKVENSSRTCNACRADADVLTREKNVPQRLVVLPAQHAGHTFIDMHQSVLCERRRAQR
jgi:hypothetical protein